MSLAERIRQANKLFVSQKFSARNQPSTLPFSQDTSDLDNEKRQLSRDQVIEIYDWIAQLNAK